MHVIDEAHASEEAENTLESLKSHSLDLEKIDAMKETKVDFRSREASEDLLTEADDNIIGSGTIANLFGNLITTIHSRDPEIHSSQMQKH